MIDDTRELDLDHIDFGEELSESGLRRAFRVKLGGSC